MAPGCASACPRLHAVLADRGSVLLVRNGRRGLQRVSRGAFYRARVVARILRDGEVLAQLGLPVRRARFSLDKRATVPNTTTGIQVTSTSPAATSLPTSAAGLPPFCLPPGSRSQGAVVHRTSLTGREVPERCIHLVMELCTGKELYDRLARKKKYSEKDAARVTRQMLSAINYCHQRHICHRDLK